MGAQFIQLPADSTGKKIRTQELTVGADTVQHQYVIPTNERVESGVYLSQTGAHVITAAATNGTSTGFWWLYNPVGSSVLLAVRRCDFMSQMATALVTASSPRIVLARFTFTGTPGGAAITPVKVDSAFATPTAILKSTQVTSVVSLVASFFAHLPFAALSASSGGPSAPGMSMWEPEEDGQMILRAGEGVTCYQPDAGSTSDTRRVVTNIAWSEFTIP